MISDPLGELRTFPRKQVGIAVLCQSGVKQESAQLVNISLTGALLESSSVNPPPGALIKIKFAPPQLDSATRIELKGRVVHSTSKGFAIKFLTITEELRELVKRLS